jgi:transcriptional regulator with XRE-family HTH domain
MINEKVIEELREYLKNHYEPTVISSLGVGATIAGMAITKGISKTYRNVSDEATDYVKANRNPEDFAHTLERIRKEKGYKPAELYKRANIDRRQYSRFMGPEGRRPSINTVILFALALQLERTQFNELLLTAGYALRYSSSRDVCIMFCIEKGIYNIDEVNTLLFTMGYEPLNRDTPA